MNATVRGGCAGGVMETNDFLLGNRNDVAAGLRMFRATHELSQSELASLSNVSLRTVQNLEGRTVRPNPLTAMKLDSFMRKYQRSRKKAVA